MCAVSFCSWHGKSPESLPNERSEKNKQTNKQTNKTTGFMNEISGVLCIWIPAPMDIPTPSPYTHKASLGTERGRWKILKSSSIFLEMSILKGKKEEKTPQNYQIEFSLLPRTEIRKNKDVALRKTKNIRFAYLNLECCLWRLTSFVSLVDLPLVWHLIQIWPCYEG